MVKKNIIGLNVKRGRKLLSPEITQKGLAEKLQLLGWNIDRVGIAKIEVGIRKVSDIEVKKLSLALEVPIEWLFKLD